MEEAGVYGLAGNPGPHRWQERKETWPSPAQWETSRLSRINSVYSGPGHRPLDLTLKAHRGQLKVSEQRRERGEPSLDLGQGCNRGKNETGRVWV